jgi:tripartite ATP-independent transporter DctM subunit
VSAATSAVKASDPRARKITLGIVGGIVAAVAALGGAIPALVILLALLGAPLFAVMGGASELAWLRHPDPNLNHFRFIAPKVLDDHFAGSPILVTIPLFTFVGYVLARAKTAERLVRFSLALVGWIPGGLAIVCVLASAIFTLLTGGSGVTIIAIGGLLLPALKKEGYSDRFSIGLLSSGGSLGLLLPFAVPLFVYAILAGVDVDAAMVAVIPPGLLVLAMFAGYAVYIGYKEKIPTRKFDVGELVRAFWELKWEAGIFLIMALGIKKFQLNIDELAGLVAFYTLLIECFVYKDISFKKDVPKIAKSAMVMAGAIILILTMANALVNYVGDQKIPDKIFAVLAGLGLDKGWQFLIILNVFLLILGMVMEGFSAIFVAVPLIIPFAARFHLGPFHVGMIFLLNLELAFCMPPLGLNLFIASFRFNRPATSLYRPIVPFLGILAAALLIISYVPSISSLTVQGRIAREREAAEKKGEPPREAWLLECVQEDRLNPKPCTPEDEKRFPDGRLPTVDDTPSADAGAAAVPDGGADDDSDDLMNAMMGGDGGAKAKSDGGDSEDDLLQQMMGDKTGKSDAGPPPLPSSTSSAAPSGSVDSEDELLKKMMGK